MGAERGKDTGALWRLFALLTCAVAALVLSCGPHGGTDSSSNWLEECSVDADCPATGRCVCGICTLACDTSNDCRGIGAGLACGVPNTCEAAGPSADYCFAGDDLAGDDDSAASSDDDASQGGSNGDDDSGGSSSGDGGNGANSAGNGGTSSQGGNGGAAAQGTSGAPPSGGGAGGAPNGGAGNAPGGAGTGGAVGVAGAPNGGNGGAPIVPDVTVTGLCSSGDWCWVNPQPQGHWIYDLAPVGDELWAAVDHGTVLRLANGEWERYELSPDSGTQIQSWAVWGASPDDVWVAAVWTGGTGGVLYRFQNGAWQSFPSPTEQTLYGMWGSSANDIWAVGWAGTIIHFDGMQWSLAEVPADLTQRLDGVYGFAPDDVWAVGSQERLLHYDGQSWTTALQSTSTTMHLRSVWGAAPDDVWAVGGDTGEQFSIALHYDGVTWTRTQAPSSLGLQAVIGSTDGEVWVTGNASQANTSTLFRVEGGRLVEFLNGVPGEYVTAATGANGDTWFGGETGTMLRYSGGSWGSVGSTLTYNALLSSAWMAADASTGFAVGYRIPQDGVLLQWNGTDWTQGAYPRTSAQQLFSVSGTAPDDVWMTGRSQLFHFDGDDWTQLDAPVIDGLAKVFARAPDDVWFAGDSVSNSSSIVVSHFDGVEWTEIPTGPMPSFVRLWTGAPGELWVLANRPYHFDGATWTEFTTTAASGDALDMWGTAPDDAWLVGTAGAIHHFDGATFTAVASPVTTDLLRVYGRAADDVYAVGTLGTILHYDGSEWTVEASGTTLDFNDVVFTQDSAQVVAWGTAILRKEL